MICLEVFVNGTKLCTAGIERPCRFDAAVSCTLRSQGEYASAQQIPDQQIAVAVKGTSRLAENVELQLWPHHLLEVGDSVLIRVIDQFVADEPEKREAKDPYERARWERTIYTRLKQKYEAGGSVDSVS